MQFIQSPIWIPLAVVVPILLSVGGYYLERRRRSRKALVCEQEFDWPLVTVRDYLSENEADALEIRFHGKPVKDVRLVVVRV